MLGKWCTAKNALVSQHFVYSLYPPPIDFRERIRYNNNTFVPAPCSAWQLAGGILFASVHCRHRRLFFAAGKGIWAEIPLPATFHTIIGITIFLSDRCNCHDCHEAGDGNRTRASRVEICCASFTPHRHSACLSRLSSVGLLIKRHCTERGRLW